jgi:hypothetical protein
MAGDRPLLYFYLILRNCATSNAKNLFINFFRPAITGERAIEAYIKQYRNFENIFFNEIWLLIYFEGYYKTYQLAKRGDNFLSKNNGKIKFERIKK